ncbi:hypothetical protein [Pelagibacterium lacus]|uniref:Uncharacterized protein n=1 Tax=Pelagibacterium lacus TaxID=2282655 RepID=A0A369W2Y9_9HYPH|nr:hypothetical protein [Pelagibacterium lacus]RDE08235.1 hypothetical protein DVH29_12430 [Pelagibacterium lacus]
MNTLNFNAEAALYLGSNPVSARREGARRFPTAAKAIRFAMEEAAPVSLRGARMVVGNHSYGPGDVKRFYNADGYPLMRKSVRQSLLEEDYEMA